MVAVRREQRTDARPGRGPGTGYRQAGESLKGGMPFTAVEELGLGSRSLALESGCI